MLRRIQTLVILGLMIGAFAQAARPGLAAPIPLTACGTISAPGQYVLSTNLTASGNCLVVAASEVSIDLGNHTITGDGTGIGIGDNFVAQKQIIVANGKIRKFLDGIGFEKSQVVTLQNIDSSHNGNLGVAIDQGNSILNNVKANNNGEGVLIGTCCNTLTNVQANGNSVTGIAIGDCCNYLTNVTANHNGENGIATTNCCTSIVSSTANGNTKSGITLSGGANLVSGSIVKKNGATGITLSDGSNSVIGSKASGNVGTGIELHNSFNTVSGSSSTGNGGRGFSVGGSSGGNRVTNCIAIGNSGTGLVFDCPGNVTNFVAKNNPRNLEENGSVNCANLNNHAP